MPRVHEICDYLESFAPLRLAEDWDNVGLLVGRRDGEVLKLMTALTVTQAVVSEVVTDGADLVVTHHPLPFRPLARITDDSVPGHLLLQLIEHNVGLYSPHTAFDSARRGINRQLAEGMGLVEPTALRPADEADPSLGSGRYGMLPSSRPLSRVADDVRKFLSIDHVRFVGDPDRPIRSVAVACGSAGQFLEDARQQGCDLLITGETSFHTCLEAEALNVALLLTGHFASEHFAVEFLARTLAEQFPDVQVWASRAERDPLHWI
jgi:dinuclear metal center YbgI/SA1388 family protein